MHRGPRTVRLPATLSSVARPRDNDLSTKNQSAALAPSGVPEASGKVHFPEYQELWLSLSRNRWSSVVLVPADRSSSCGELAKSLAEVGKELVGEPVTAITVSRLEYDSARSLSELQMKVASDRDRLNGNAPHEVVEMGRRDLALPALSQTGSALASPASATRVHSRLIIAIPPVVDEPLGVAVAHHADGVVLAIRLGKTTFEEARRTIDLVGREKILGCFIVR